jgi:hypothetical protein
MVRNAENMLQRKIAADELWISSTSASTSLLC